MDLRVFVDVEADRRLIRRIDRDMVERGRSFASIVHQYLSTVTTTAPVLSDLGCLARCHVGRACEALKLRATQVKTMHDLYVEPSKAKADIIIPFGGRNVAAVQVCFDHSACARSGFGVTLPRGPRFSWRGSRRTCATTLPTRTCSGSRKEGAATGAKVNSQRESRGRLPQYSPLSTRCVPSISCSLWFCPCPDCLPMRLQI